MFGREVENIAELVEHGVEYPEGVWEGEGRVGDWFRRKGQSILRIRELETRDVYIASSD